MGRFVYWNRRFARGIVITSAARNLLLFASWNCGWGKTADPSQPKAVRDDNSKMANADPHYHAYFNRSCAP
jgi:hypothetical protein